MNLIKINLILITLLFASATSAWEAKVTKILQHGGTAAIYLEPNPGPLNCEVGQPYIVIVDETPASQQRFSMLLTALTAKMTVSGYTGDACSTSIWGQSRPTIRRLNLHAN